MSLVLVILMVFTSVDMTVFAADTFSSADNSLSQEVMSEDELFVSKLLSADAVMERAEENGNTVSGMEGEGTVSGSDTVSGADGPAITAVILSLNEGALRIRAWSSSEGIRKVNAVVTCYLADGSSYKFNQELGLTEGYYTSHLLVDPAVTKIRTLVGAVDTEGKIGYKAVVVFPENSSLEAEKVSNDLWIRFLDGEGSDKSVYTYTGKAIKPKVEIYEGTVLLEEKKDYTLSYKMNKNAGNSNRKTGRNI